MWFKRIFRPPALKQVAQPVRPKVPFGRGYSLSEFRSNEALVEETRKFFQETALGGHILAALLNSLPTGHTMDPNPSSVAIELGRIRGFMDALNTIQAMCVPMQREEHIPVDYGAGDIPEDQL